MSHNDDPDLHVDAARKAGNTLHTTPCYSDMCEYAPLSRLSVRSRMKRLESIYQEMEQQWKVEVSTYERGGSDGDAHDDRNHANNSLTVVHKNLFPYHDAMYPLMDVYYHLEEEDWTRTTAVRVENYPSPVLGTTERRQMRFGEVNVPGYLPNSAYAVFVSLVPEYRASFWRYENTIFEDTISMFDIQTRKRNRAENFTFFYAWERDLSDDEEVIRDGKWMSKLRAEYLEESREDNAAEFGPHKLPTDAKARAMILTKIVKHALSDLQKDHRLARASVMLMAELRLFDDNNEDDGIVDGCDADEGSNNNGADILARLLAVVASEYVNQCDWRCHERYGDAFQGGGDGVLAEDDDALSPPTHFCSDWKNMVRKISTCVSNGITFVTEAHAETIVGFTLLEYDGISSAAAEIDRQYFESGVPGGRDDENDGSTRNAVSFLKQNLFYHNNTSIFDGATAMTDPAGNELEGHDAGESFRLSMVCSLVGGLGCHAAKERTRLKKLVDISQLAGGDATALKEIMYRTVASYHNCIRTIVSIGEHTIRRLPPNSRSAEVGSAIVRVLVLASVDHYPSKLTETGYIGDAIAHSEGKSLLNPTRFANAVTEAAENVRDVSDNLFAVPPDATIEDAVRRVLVSAPHRDVHDVIKGLFVRNLVDTDIAGCGYGDYLVWCRLPISPLDPLLYVHSVNFPDLQREEESWVVDEEGKGLMGPELASRFDFTILMLQRAWQEPWTAQSHRSFSMQQRDAMKALAQCAWKHRMPNEIALRVNSFLPRSWWPDDRKQCWCHDCQLVQLSTSLREKITAREAPTFSQQDGGTQVSKPSRSTTSIPSTQAQIPATMHNVSLMRPLSYAEPKNSGSADLFECKCGVVHFCSKEHRKYLMQDGHKRMCGTPPFRPHGIDEELLCREVFASSQDDLCLGGSDADSCWESVDSNEDEETQSVALAPKTKTELIYRFFGRHSYKALEVERPALAGHAATAFQGP